MADDKITKLPVRFKHQGKTGKTLERVWSHECMHEGIYLVDDTKADVECGQCGEKLNPMWVLSHMAGKETRWSEAHNRYQDEMKRLTERSRTKCEYCGKMTRISRR